MSTLPLTTPATAPLLTRQSSPSSWLREPLLHFVLLGGLLFAADHFLVGRKDDAHTIVIGADVDAEARRVFRASRSRDPNTQELEALRRIWLDNEVLYREGVALGLDKGDTAIRDRVIFKALSVVDANTKLPPIEDQTLRKWFEEHRSKYDEPPRLDFEEVVLTGDTSEATVRAFVANLNSGASGETGAGLRVFKGRPQVSIVQTYGADFAAALQASPVGEWRALPTKIGYRAIRLTGTTKAKSAAFENVRNAVLQDWTDETLAQQRTAAVRALAKKYTVKTEVAGK